MLLESEHHFAVATRDIDYVASILLSGAVIGIVGPLLNEQGGRTMHQLLAKISDVVAEPEDDHAHEGMFRAVYNALKHAGNDRYKWKPSDDLEIHTDLRTEAAYMLDAAVENFQKIKIAPNIRAALSEEFVAFLTAYEGYA